MNNLLKEDLARPRRIKPIPIWKKKKVEWKYCGVFQGKPHIGTDLKKKPKDGILKEKIPVALKK